MRKKVGILLAAMVFALMAEPVLAEEFSEDFISSASADFTDSIKQTDIFITEDNTPSGMKSQAVSGFDTQNVVFDDMEFEYLLETDSYRLVHGVNSQEVVIPVEINGKKVTEIGKRAFYGFKKLKVVRTSLIPVTPIIIHEEAFRGCEYLHTVIFDNTDVHSKAFVDCPRLAAFTSYADDGRVNSFAADTFDKDSKVVIYSYYSNCSEIYPGFFCHNPENGGEFVYDGVAYLNEYLIDFGDTQSDVMVKKGISTIRRKAFYGCTTLGEVYIPEGLKTMETKAFYGCRNLKKITIPASVTSISPDTFENCPNVVIYAPKGSYALKYAKKYGISYKVSTIEKMPVPKLSYSAKTHTFTWDHVKFADGYQIYAYNSTTKKYERAETIRDGNIHSYCPGLSQGRSVYYKIRAFSNNGIYSGKYSAFSPKVLVKTRTDIPAVQSISNTTKKQLTINWTRPRGTEGYILYRSEKPDSGFVKIKNITKAETTKYTDKNVKSGKTYYYKVRTYRRLSDGTNLYSEYSDAAKQKCR